MPTGRPTKFTAGRIAVILQTLRKGNTRTAAAAMAGIDFSTLKDWYGAETPLVLPEDISVPPLEEGDEAVVYEKGTLFPAALSRAEGEAEQHLVDRVMRAGTQDAKVTYIYDRQGNLLREVREYDWRAAAWLLDHSPKLRQNWLPKAQVEMSGPGGGPVPVEGKHVVSFTPDAAFLARVQKLADEVLPDAPKEEAAQGDDAR